MGSKYYLYDSVHNGVVYMPSAGEQPNDGNYIIKCGVSMVEWLHRVSGRLIDYEQHTSVERTRFAKDTRGSPWGRKQVGSSHLCQRHLGMFH